MDIVEKIEEKANAQGWLFKKVIYDVCTSCGEKMSGKEGFVLTPAMNYPICMHCAVKEFK